jgi:hypothetical protein
VLRQFERMLGGHVVLVAYHRPWRPRARMPILRDREWQGADTP